VNELFVRTFSAVVMMLIAVAAALQGGYYFAVLVAAAATAIFYEWTRIVRGWGAAWYLSGFVYALVPALALLWVRDRADHGLALLLWVFVVTWATDIGAYFVGRSFGRTKLAPSISPGKTVEGLYGGMAGAAILGGGWVWLTGLSPTLLVSAPLFALAAQGGDLFESGMKRRAGMKDSGNWLPGHGGLLDRLDGLVPVAILTAAVQLAGLV
jgi:phosphatidate cytidylyltransferase